MDLNNDLGDLDRLIREYAPEIYEIWDKRVDSSEEQGIRTGRLHENHILGILFKHLIEGEPEVTTTDIEEEYEIFFKKIARSTVSTYLNQLEKEEVLFKKRDGRAVKYLFNIPPPNNIDAFWTVRNFCLLPPYLSRASILAKLYFHPPKTLDKHEEERKFLIGLSVLTILKDRHEKCHLCQFGSKQFYREATDSFESLIKERIDVLPEELRNFILFEIGELPIFKGIFMSQEKLEDLNSKILDFVERYHNDIEFQISVSKHRQKVHLKRMDSVDQNSEEQKNK